MLSYITKLYRLLKNKKKQRYIQTLQSAGLTLGDNVNIVDDFFFDSAHCYLISIGSNTTLAPGVNLVAHDASLKNFLGYTKFGRIAIGENCFLGHSVIVLCGVTIGDNSIVGAGSVVTKDVPPNSVVAGSPAKIICSLDEYLERYKVDVSQVFDERYHIYNLDESKRQQLLDAAANGKGYIV